MNVNKELNKRYYEDYKPCNCGYCKYFYKQIKLEQPEICEFLESLNVNPIKPFELVPIKNDNKIEYLNCMYVVYGSVEKDFKKIINNIEINVNINNHPKTSIVEDHFILDFGPIILPYKYRTKKHLKREERLTIVKAIVDKYDPMGLLEIDCPPDEYMQEARMIENSISKRRNYIGMPKEIQQIFFKQFKEIIPLSKCRKMFYEIQVAIDLDDFIKDFDDVDELKGKVKIVDGIITMRVHDDFVVTTDGFMTYINGKEYYQIDDQDLVVCYQDFLINNDVVYIQLFRKSSFISSLFNFKNFKEIKKNRFSIDTMKKLRNVDIAFDNKGVLYANQSLKHPLKENRIRRNVIKTLKGTQYTLISIKVYYEAFGNIEVVISDSANLYNFVSDRGEIIYNNVMVYPSDYMSDTHNSVEIKIVDSIRKLVDNKIMRWVTKWEKLTLKKFLDCKIPEEIRLNSIDYKFDLMECYEEIFNSSHVILDDYYVYKKDVNCIFDGSFIELLNELAENQNLNEFSSLAKSSVKIIKKYSR